MPRELVAAPSATSLSSRGSSSSQSASNTPFATPPSSPPDNSTMAFPASVSRIPLSVQPPSKPTLIAKFRSGSSSSNSSQQQTPPPAPSSGSGIRVLGASSTRRPSQSTGTREGAHGTVAGSSWSDTRSPPAVASSLPSGPPSAFGTSPSAASPAPVLSTSADARILGTGQPLVQRAPAMKRTSSAEGSSRIVASGKVSATASPSLSSSSALPAPPPPPAGTSSSSSSGPRKQRSASALPRRVAGASPRSVNVPSLPSSTNTSPARTPPLATASTFDALLASSPPHTSSPAIALQQATPPRPTPSTPGSAQRTGLPFPQQPTSPSKGSTHIADRAPTSTPGGNRQRTDYHAVAGGLDRRLSPPSATSPSLEGAESIESVVDLSAEDSNDGHGGGGSSVGSHKGGMLNGGRNNQNRYSRIPTPTNKSANGTPVGGSPRSPAMGLYEDLAGSSRSTSPARSGAGTPSKSRLPRMAHSSVEGAAGNRRGSGGLSGSGGGGGDAGSNSGVPGAPSYFTQATPSTSAENTSATTTAATTPTTAPTSPRVDRKSPGLTIAPPPIPNHHLNSIKAPPVPARSPLRGPGLNRSASRKSISSIRTIRPDPEASSPPPPLPLPRQSPPAAVAQTAATAPTSPVARANRSPASSPPAANTAASAAALFHGAQDVATPSPPEPSTTAAAGGDMMMVTPPSEHAVPAAISTSPAFSNIAYAPAPLTSMSAPPLSNVGSPVEEGSARFPTTERPDFPSVYSQESAPPSAPPCSENVWSVGGASSAPMAPSRLQPPAILSSGSQLHESPIEEDEPLTMIPKRDSLRNSLQWGQKRDSGQGHLRRGSAAVGSEESHVANMGHTTVDLHGKALPTLPAMSPQSAPRSKDSSIPHTPTTPNRPTTDKPATRSPSMPQLPVPRTRARGNTESSPKYQRSQTGPVHLRPGQSGHTRPKSMVFPFFPPSPATSSLSKRAHLIREIANTERAHATDLQLIQQAYVGSYIRPDSHHSVGTNGESSNSSGGARVDSQHSQRSSSYGTPGSDETRRTSAAESGGQRVSGHERKSLHERRSGHERRISGHDLTKAFGGLMSPVFRGNNTPRERGNSDRSIEHTQPGGSMASIDTLYPSGSSTAASSLSINTPVYSSPRTPTQSETALLTKMGPPVGRPLQPADLKAVFLNISQLAEASNELATAFENAMGSEEDLLQGSGERGSDHMGEVFSKMLSTLRPLYTYYCARQSSASARLTELMADPATAAYLNDCWLRVKSHTHAWNLDSMLIKPVQRITKYPLLFDDLLSCTSPSHPDYHHIRHAAEGARALALEIDDAKRRKDVITSVIRKSPSIPSVNKDNKLPGAGGRLLALRRFKKDKSPSMSGTNTPGDSGGMPLDITPYAQSQLKELVNRLEEGEHNVRKVGKEMLEWASATKILLSAESEVNSDFWKMYSLSGTTSSERPHVKIEAYHNVQKEILATVWAEMNSEVCNSIMLMLGKLLDATKNPMTIIEKLNRKSSEYARYVAFKQAKKTIDRPLLSEASDYVAIHTQLLEELPDFLDGYQKIFDMAMSAFIMTQARFYEGIRDRVQLFAIQYLTTRPIDSATKQEQRISHARGIHRMFYNENSSADKAIQRIGCVNGDLSGRPATVHEAKSPGAASNKSELQPLRHTASTRSNKSRSRESSQSSGHSGRTRSVSLVQRDDALSRSGSISAGNNSRLLRRPSQLAQRHDSSHSEGSNRSSSAFSIGGGAGNRSTASVPPLDRSSHSRSESRLTVLSTDSTEESIGRHSFGLPRIPLEGGGFAFDSFGFSPSKPSTPIYGRHDINNSGQSSPTAATDPALAALGLVNGSNSDVLTVTMKHRSQPNQSSPLSNTTTSSASVISNEPDASTSWQGSKTLYSCQAVADFNPAEHGNKRFQGLLFLPLNTGDLVNVYHEVGRVADLRDFPYTSVGVENDGAVVCCAENGAIGVAMCSFLEPLQA